MAPLIHSYVEKFNSVKTYLINLNTLKLFKY